MACSITVDWGQTTGFTKAGALDRIYVQGTATDCGRVSLTLTIEGIALPAVDVQVGATGVWFHTFDKSDLPAHADCNKAVKVKAVCAESKTLCVNPDHDQPIDLACKSDAVAYLCPLPNLKVGSYGPCDGDGNRQMTVEAELASPGPSPIYVEAEMRDAATGGLLKAGQGNTPLTISHTGTFTIGSAPVFELKIVQPGGCYPVKQTITVPDCESMPESPNWEIVKLGDLPVFIPPKGRVEPKEPPTHPPEDITPGGNGESETNVLCGSMVWIVGGAMALTAAAVGLTLAVNLCLPAAAAISWWWAIGPAIGAAVLVAAWYLLCAFVPNCPCPTACDWAQIATMSALASAAILAWMAGCCPVVLAISGGFLAAFTAALVSWAKLCNPTACTVILACLVAIVSGAAPALAYLAWVPPLAACGSKLAAAVVATVAALLGVAAGAKCPQP